MTDDDAEKIQQQNYAAWLCSVPAIVWGQIGEWGRLTAPGLTFHQQQVATDVARKIRQWGVQAPQKLTGGETGTATHILDIIIEQAPQLLENMPDEIYFPEPEPTSHKPASQQSMTLELVQKAVAWDKRKKILSIKNHIQLKDIAEGRRQLTEHNIPIVGKQIRTLVHRGFDPGM